MENEIKRTSKRGLTAEDQKTWETYLSPRPPLNGKIIGLDCHPDTYTAAVFIGRTPHDARKITSRCDMSLRELLRWAGQEFSHEDLFLLEAGTNSFEIYRRLLALGLNAIVMESAHVGKHTKTYADNDKLAAARIALVYLAGNAPCVWVPDEQTKQRRELLHAHQSAVVSCTAATNALKGYLAQFTIRLGGRGVGLERTHNWILTQREWSDLQKEILKDHFATVDYHTKRRVHLQQLMTRQICADPMMLRCMKLLGIATINAFALLAIIGDVRRFDRPEKLVAYLGLNPGRRKSGMMKDVKVGIGRRGRADMRNLLIQGAHAVLRRGGRTPIGMWGWKLFARKGSRNVAIAAIARKMVVQVWHLLCGNSPTSLEADTSLMRKFQRLGVTLGRTLRVQIGLPAGISACALELHRRMVGAAEPEPV